MAFQLTNDKHPKEIHHIKNLIPKVTNRTTTTTPKYFPHTWGVGRSRCMQSYPYAYKPRKEISFNNPTENVFEKINDFKKHFANVYEQGKRANITESDTLSFQDWLRN